MEDLFRGGADQVLPTAGTVSTEVRDVKAEYGLFPEFLADLEARLARAAPGRSWLAPSGAPRPRGRGP
jgi:hypothetical protein